MQGIVVTILNCKKGKQGDATNYGRCGGLMVHVSALVSGSSRLEPWPGTLPLQIGIYRTYTKIQV